MSTGHTGWLPFAICTLPGSHRVVTFCYMYTSWVMFLGYGIWDIQLSYSTVFICWHPFLPFLRMHGVQRRPGGTRVVSFEQTAAPRHPCCARGDVVRERLRVPGKWGGFFFFFNALHMTITLTHVLGHIERFPWGVCTYTSQSVDLFFDVGRVT